MWAIDLVTRDPTGRLGRSQFTFAFVHMPFDPITWDKSDGEDL